VNLLVVAPEYPPAIGGMEVHAEHLVRELARRHSVHLLVERDREAPPAPEGATVEAALTRRWRRSLRHVLDAARRAPPDAILALNAAYGALGRAAPCPVVVRVVGNDFTRAWIGPRVPGRFLFWRLPSGSAASPGRWLRRLDQRYRNRAVQRGLDTCRTILPNSHYTDGELVRCGVIHPERRVIIGGVDLGRFAPEGRDAARAALGLPAGVLLLTAARLTRKKGIDLLLRAVAAARRSHPELTLVVVGRGEEQDALERQARDGGLAGAVSFAGSVSHALLPRYYAACDVYLQPSRRGVDPIDGSIDVETMGRAVCEAAACDRPALVTCSGGLPDVVEDGVTGAVVPEDDAAALAAAIERLAGDPVAREALGRAAGRRARDLFGWESVARRTEEAIADACGRSAGSQPHPAAARDLVPSRER
jgi:glycosyltransferase involved in cell wall biosynthesis